MISSQKFIRHLQRSRPFQLVKLFEDLLDVDPMITPLSENSPAIDVIEHPKEYVIEAEIPGIKKEDLHVELSSNRRLTIWGEFKRNVSRAPSEQGLLDEERKETEDSVLKRNITAAESENQPPSRLFENVRVGPSAIPSTYWLNERIKGSFKRVITLNAAIDKEKITTKFDNGVLSIVLPKKFGDDDVHTIEIQ
jgi:HSP20 family molecular chaperone IbpA